MSQRSKHVFYEFRVRRVRRTYACDRPIATISTAPAGVELFRRLSQDEPREMFMAMSLDVRNQCLGVEITAIGTSDGVEVRPRELFRAAILTGAAALIVAHNHPSGDPTPSMEDIEITRRLAAAGHVLAIPILDHLIVTEHTFYSFHANNAAALEIKPGDPLK